MLKSWLWVSVKPLNKLWSTFWRTPDRESNDDKVVSIEWGRKVVTWLILPVVICLSQRLSHACLSINEIIQWNCEWLIKSVIVYLMIPCYMDNCGNSRANTCRKISTSGRDVFIRSKASGLRVSLVNHDNCSNRMALRRRCFIQISALSTFDGRIEAYHGDDG